MIEDREGSETFAQLDTAPETQEGRSETYVDQTRAEARKCLERIRDARTDEFIHRKPAGSKIPKKPSWEKQRLLNARSVREFLKN